MAPFARAAALARGSPPSSLCWSCRLKQRHLLSQSYSTAASVGPQKMPSGKAHSTIQEAASTGRFSTKLAQEKFVEEEQLLFFSALDDHRRHAQYKYHQHVRSARSNVSHPSAELPGAKRHFHSYRNLCQVGNVTGPGASADLSNFVPGSKRKTAARDYLQQWQKKHGLSNKDLLEELGLDDSSEGVSTNLARLSDPDDIRDLDDPEKSVDEEERTRHAAELLDDPTNGKFLNKGDLVEIMFPGVEREPLLAVFVKQFETQSQFYSIDGKWFHRKLNDVQFTVQDFMDPSLIDPIVPYLPSKEVTSDLIDKMQLFDISAPREIASPVIFKLKQFAQEADAIHRKHASLLENAHKKLAHQVDLRFGTLQKITETLLNTKKPPITVMYAVRKALMHQPLGFMTDMRSHRLTSVFQIIPKDLVERLEQARDWIREYQESMALDDGGPRSRSKDLKGAAIVKSFAAKARTLVEQSRRMREPTMYGRLTSSKNKFDITPTSTALRVVESLEFTESEQILIRFLEAWSMSSLLRSSPRLLSLCPILLRAVGVYDPSWQNQSSLGFVFLQEIGVIPPHENRIKFDPHLLLPTAQHSRQLEQLFGHLEHMGTDKTKAATYDAMKHLRRDYGDRTVFCVDSATAEEIDDGISLERIPDRFEYWVHVHVANPTAFLPKDHLASKMAAHLTETIYMPERTYPMLPSWITQEKFSLAPNRPCLTISIKLNDDADVLDVKMQSGFIRNVVSMTPPTVERIVTGKDVSKESGETEIILTVGGKVPEIATRKIHEETDLSESQISDLKTLQALAMARNKKRRQAGGIFWDQGYPEFSVYDKYDQPGVPWSTPSRDRARFTDGDPVIQMRANSSTNPFSTAGAESEILVREIMLLAGEVGAKWCRDRNLPVIYRGMVKRPGTMDMKEYENTVMKPALREDGSIPFSIAMDYLKHIGASVASTTPYEHGVLGTPQYAKMTSPLRRYGDMVMHWQIESAMRLEHKLGRSLVGSTYKEQELAFTKKDIEAIISRLTPRERLISKTKRNAQSFWLSQLFFRAIMCKEADLPETFEVYITSIPNDNYPRVVGWSLKYSFDMDVHSRSFKEIGDEPKLGDMWEVTITDVDCYHRRMRANPVRLIKRAAI